MSPAARVRKVMVGGIGLPWRRDLDIGRLLVGEIVGEEWAQGVLVEDLSYSAHRVMHTLQIHQPDKLILVGSVSRGVDPPGTIRRYKPQLEFTDEDVVAMLGEAVGGIIDLDHMLIVNDYFGTLPEDTVVIEIETGDEAFGVGYSTEVDAAIPEVRDLIKAEVES